MYTKFKFAIPLFVLLAGFLTACDSRMKFIAPEIEPPADLIPGYVPKGFELGFGFQLSGETILPATSNGDDVSHFAQIRDFDLKSPNGNDIQGVYYQGKDHLILITRSYFPEGTLDLWLAAYDAAQPKLGECECAGIPRLDAIPSPARFAEIQEERTVNGIRVAALTGPMGWTTVFVRGDYLLTVESGISLEENLKIVASLLDG